MFTPPKRRPPAKTEQSQDKNVPVFAALDLGTNNCRLLIARPSVYPIGAEYGIKVLDSFSRIVRLGEGLSASNRLLPEAMQRTLAALKTCQKKVERLQVPFVRYVATEACCGRQRTAKNFLHW